ncbi:hypothetical protein ACIBFB_13225 [Nocardiopsis sp. NPDC050513]|uniref:hypothetical protein n=1 Tax=Nocardiopsis sp. NPDC050513 TaxID=3364338 RepID=UPI0037BB55A0
MRLKSFFLAAGVTTLALFGAAPALADGSGAPPSGLEECRETVLERAESMGLNEERVAELEARFGSPRDCAAVWDELEAEREEREAELEAERAERAEREAEQQASPSPDPAEDPAASGENPTARPGVGPDGSPIDPADPARPRPADPNYTG